MELIFDQNILTFRDVNGKCYKRHASNLWGEQLSSGIWKALSNIEELEQEYQRLKNNNQCFDMESKDIKVYCHECYGKGIISVILMESEVFKGKICGVCKGSGCTNVVIFKGRYKVDSIDKVITKDGIITYDEFLKKDKWE